MRKRWLIAAAFLLAVLGPLAVRQLFPEEGRKLTGVPLEDLATDTIAAVDYLASRDDLGIDRIGVVGMSQGGWIAPVAASRSPRIQFVVSFAGAAVTPREQLYFEEVYNLRQAGFLPGVAHGIAVLSTTVIRKIGQRDFWQRVDDFDPLPYWDAIPVTGLLVFGAQDTNVPTARSAALIRNLDNPRLQVVVLEGSGHAIQDPEGVGMRVIRREATDTVAEFVLERNSHR